MYTAHARPSRKTDDEIEKLFDVDAPDLKGEITPSNGLEVYEMLKKALVLADFEFDKPKKSAETEEGDQVEDAPDAPDAPADEVVDEEAKKAAAAKRAAAKKKAAAAEKAAEAAREAEKAAERAEKAAEEADEVEAEAAKKAADKKAAKTSTKKVSTKKVSTKKVSTKKVAVDEKPKDDVEVPDGYEDPGPKPDDDNVGWWPDRAKGEPYDLCPKCERPVREDHMSCPHKDCGVNYAPVDGSKF